jgi:hypothetical protein
MKRESVRLKCVLLILGESEVAAWVAAGWRKLYK